MYLPLSREWRKKRADELEQKANISREKHAQVACSAAFPAVDLASVLFVSPGQLFFLQLVEEARALQEEFYKKRETKNSQSREGNR